MKTLLSTAAIISCLFLGACSTDNNPETTANKEKTSINKDLNVAEFQKLSQKEPGIILDVRTPGEIAQGTIPGAMVIDWNGNNFSEEVSKLDKTKPIYVYCKSGGRSSSACGKMQSLGFEKIYNLSGGITAWKSAGNEVATNN